MKKFLIIIIILLGILGVFCVKYIDYKTNKNTIIKNNLNFEVYLNKQINGNELTTVINKAVDNNENNKVKKDENGFYIQNEENSVKIEVTTTDLDKEVTYNMESFYLNDMENFYKLYSQILFECVKIEYNKYGKVNYLLFIQR